MERAGDNDGPPALEGEAAKAVAHRGGHTQIIAGAGSGKTEVVSQRVASLVSDGVNPSAIVAFTFTDKAATELKERIRARVEDRIGAEATDRLGQLQVSTIHAFCFRLLQTHVPLFETYSVLDENQLVSLLSREGGSSRLDLKRFGPGGRKFKGIDRFLKAVDVVENELLDPDNLPDDEFKETLFAYYEVLERYRAMTYGLQIVRAVRTLEDPKLHAQITAGLEHLIVDEYQDINPAQERLIGQLAKPVGSADLVVVGDDDQAIYQWRGSDVTNIVAFRHQGRYPDATQFRLLVNRRSRPPIVEVANSFVETISERLEKTMQPDRAELGPSVNVAEGFASEEEEADFLAMTIKNLADQGVPYRAMAVLVRGKVAYRRILEAFAAYSIPVQPGGRSGLFEQGEAAALGATFAWLADVDWAANRYDQREEVRLADLVALHAGVFDLEDEAQGELRSQLEQWKQRVPSEAADVDLIGELYDLLALLGVRSWDLDEQTLRNRLGTIARFAAVLADYESVTRRARRDANNPGEQVGGQGRGEWYYKNLAILLVNYATGNYDDFDGEAGDITDAVDLGTVHGAKGLEWPVVFLPSLTDGRFPSSRVGERGDWLVPRQLFDAPRYEGTDDDERRLFYVALTRARDWVGLSSHRRVNKQQRAPSPYLTHVAESVESPGLPDPDALELAGYEPELAITYSDLAAYRSCPRSYLLRTRLGFLPPVATELGYGNAVHHLMRAVAERAREKGELPTPREINELLNTDFFLPFANKAAHREMKERARRLVFKYVRNHPEDLMRTWATERPFELYLDGIVVSGRADVIYDEHHGQADNLAIVDYKTATKEEVDPLQLQVYADAGRREGLTVGAAFVHDMNAAERHSVSVDQPDVEAAEAEVLELRDGLRSRDFAPKPAPTKCSRCDVRKMCNAAVLS